jgi:hypothetical protein
MANAIPNIDKESLIKEYRESMPFLSDEQVESYAALMSEKYSTIKTGDNVIHLEYYDGMIVDDEINEIENNIGKVGLELSRFDKNGVMYANIEDFTLQVSLWISTPVIQNVLLGIGTNALWDSIKLTSIFIWKKMKLRAWHASVNERKRTMNFGLSVRLDKNRRLDLKLDGEVDEQTTIQSLDKIIDLLKSEASNDAATRGQFFVFDASKKEWKEINVKEELYKIALKKGKNK